MKCSFILNGEDVSIQTPPSTLLIDIIRDHFGLKGGRTGCMQGECGLCSVLLEGGLTLACLIPAFRAHRSEVITIEGFVQTDDYLDVERGFADAGFQPCDFCRAGCVLATHALLLSNATPTETELQRATASIRCRCSAGSRFIDGIRNAAQYRRERENVQKSKTGLRILPG
ncbi:MAG: (2Fe-2S)-binding protein [Spirochaetaceae bacterium]